MSECKKAESKNCIALMPSLKLCYVLSYREPRYIRTRTLLEALERLPGIEVYTAINRRRDFWRYFETLWQLWQIRRRYHPDCYLLGFRGHEIFWPVYLIADKPLIFDSLMSPFAAMRDDRKFGRSGATLSGFWYFVERSILRRADSILTDTRLHEQFLSECFQLPQMKIHAVPVGAVETIPIASSRTDQFFNVLFYGSFLPLHGMGIILQAAALLRDYPIYFTFIGGSGRRLAEFRQLCRSLRLSRFNHLSWVEFDELLNHYIGSAHLCLGGPFGDTPQARRVMTGKTMQCLALGKATVVGEVAEEFGLVDKHNCLLVKQGDPEALAEAIAWGYDNREQLPQIGENGKKLYQERLSVERIASVLAKILVNYKLLANSDISQC